MPNLLNIIATRISLGERGRERDVLVSNGVVCNASGSLERRAGHPGGKENQKKDGQRGRVKFLSKRGQEKTRGSYSEQRSVKRVVEAHVWKRAHRQTRLVQKVQETYLLAGAIFGLCSPKDILGTQ